MSDRSTRRGLIAWTSVVSVVATVGAAAIVPAIAGATQASPGCTPYMAYLVPGTWETSAAADPSKPAGLLRSVGDKLTKFYGSNITVVYPNYSASAFDKGLTYASSEAQGVQRLKDLVAECPGSKKVLGGYSQGADIAGDVAWQIGHNKGSVPADEIVAVGLIADPKQGNSTVVGPQPDGLGLAGVRAGGFGALQDRVRQVCAPGDLYCSVNDSEHSFIAGLGEALGSGPNVQATVDTSGQVHTIGQSDPPTAPAADSAGSLGSLTSDYGRADLPAAVATTTALNEQVALLQGQSAPTSGGQASELASAASLAGRILETFGPVADSQQWVSQTPGATQYLQAAQPGTPAAQANSLLSTLGGMDVQGILSTATSIAQVLSQALGSSPTVPITSVSSTPPEVTTSPSPDSSAEAGNSATTTSASAPQGGSQSVPGGAGEVGSVSPRQGTDTLPATTSTAAPDFAALAASATQLVAQVSPLNSADQAALSSASSVLGGLKPEVIIGQGLNVVSAVVGTDYLGIVANLQRLPQQIFAGDIGGAHKTAGDLNNQFSPWVKMAAQVDYKTAAQLVSLIPDTSGTTQIASLVLGLLGNLDIVRLARNVGQIQEVAWKVLETRDLFALTQLLPIGLDLASVALGVLEPGAKMSPDLLGAGATPEQQALAAGVQGQDMAGVFGSLTQLVSSPGAQDLSKLVGEGLTAATFYATNAHGSYDSLVVDGKLALDWLYDYFRQALGA